MRYEPRHAHGVANPNAADAPDAPDTTSGAWISAPPTSLLVGWLYVYEKGWLTVWFKNKSGGAGWTYRYTAPSRDEGQAVSDAMDRSEHPFGSVLLPRVIKAGWTYTRL